MTNEREEEKYKALIKVHFILYIKADRTQQLQLFATKLMRCSYIHIFHIYLMYSTTK